MVIKGNPPDCPILCNWVLDNFLLTDEFFAKTLQSLETCVLVLVLVNNNLCGKLASSLESPTAFGGSFRVTPIPLCIPDVNLWSC